MKYLLRPENYDAASGTPPPLDVASELALKSGTTHTHVTGAHTHTEAEVTNLPTDLAAKALTGHTHAYANAVHTHPETDVTALVTDLAGKAAAVHTHTEADVTNLVTDLSGKSPTAHTHSLTTAEASRTTDLTLVANTLTDAITVSLAAGTWLIVGHATVASPVNLVQRVTCRLWDGTTVGSSGEATSPAMGAALTGVVTVTLEDIVVLASPATLRLSVASSAASVVKATPVDNATGSTNTATGLRGVKIA